MRKVKNLILVFLIAITIASLSGCDRPVSEDFVSNTYGVEGFVQELKPNNEIVVRFNDGTSQSYICPTKQLADEMFSKGNISCVMIGGTIVDVA